MRRNGGAGRPGHVVGEHGGTPARKNGSELGNAVLPALDSGQGGDAGAEEALAKLLAGWLCRRWGGVLGRSH